MKEFLNYVIIKFNRRWPDEVERLTIIYKTVICVSSHFAKLPNSLYHLLPPYRTSDLRLRGHPFQLPDYYTDLHKKSFIVRSLYEYIKYNSRLLVLVVLLLCVFIAFIFSLFSLLLY